MKSSRDTQHPPPDSAKQALRRRIGAARRQLLDKDALSRTILKRLAELDSFRQGRVVLWYVDVRHEVRTRRAICDALGQRSSQSESASQIVVVPYCVGDHLELFRLESFDELAPGEFGILEPREELREQKERRIPLTKLDLIITPGVAFDRQGGRLGQGRGFYDRLLSQAPAHTLRVGLAFECQLVESIPRDEHDRRMDLVITEEKVYNTQIG